MLKEGEFLVSIVVPAYNHEDFIGGALRSCVDQTYQRLEIIIVNDGSKDNTGKICKDFVAADDRIRYFEHPNRGAHVAINEGIRIASGSYVAILNSDDIFPATKIERCIKRVQEEQGLGLISGKVEFVDQKGRILKKGVEVDWLRRAYGFLGRSGLFPLSILNENFVATTSNMFFSKDLWERTGGFQPLRYCHDLDFLLSSFRVGRFFFDTDNTHVRYRIHPSNTIKEDLSGIRVEIAAVIAVSLCDYRVGLLGEVNEKNVDLFGEFQRNKGLSHLIIFLMMLYLECSGRQEFYERLQGRNLQKILRLLLP